MPALIVVGCAGTPAGEHVANRNQFRECRSSQSRHTHFSNLRPRCHVEDTWLWGRLAKWAT